VLDILKIGDATWNATTPPETTSQTDNPGKHPNKETILMLDDTHSHI